MERWQIIVIALVASVVWMVYKRYTGRNKEPYTQRMPTRQGADQWYRDAQEKIANIDDEIKKQRESSWSEMDQDQQLAYSKAFLEGAFGSAVLTRYSTEEILQLGITQFIIDTEVSPGESD